MLSSKHQKTKLYILSTTLFIYFTIPSFAEMPQSWYKIDEDHPKQSDYKLVWEEPNREFDKEVSDLFDAQGDSYDALLQESSYAYSKSFNNWELSVIRSQLALSSDGVLGILALKGTVAAELRWFRKSFLKEFDASHDLPIDTAPHATLNLDMNEEEINQVLVSIVNKAVQTGRISNRNLMLAGLKEKVRKTKHMLFRVPDTSEFPFSLFRFRVELIFSASGRVLPFMTAGGNVRIRLDWDLTQSVKSSRISQQSQINRNSNDSFDKLVTAFCEDMGVLVQRDPFGSKFRVKGFQIRIGQTTGGQVGVARASGSIAGMLFFKKNRSFHIPKDYNHKEPEKSATINLIRSKITQYPDSSYILSDKYMAKGYSEKSNIITINRRRFRQGLKKAEKIGSYLMDQANRIESRNWALREIRTDYQFSLAGSLGIATIGGFGELRIEYTNNY